MSNQHHKNIATCIHLSSFSRFFVPLGNILGPVLLWVINKDKSEFIDQNGKQIINFQMSIFLYTIIAGTLSVPFFIFKLFSHINYINVDGFLDFSINIGEPSPLLYIGGALGGLAVLAFIFEMLLIALASIKARDGEIYNYPLTIQFIK